MKETEFDVWVVDSDYHRMPVLKQYTAVRLNPQSVTVRAGGRIVVIKAAGYRTWFTDKAAAKDHLRDVCRRLKASLESELAKVTDALDRDTFLGSVVLPGAPAPIDPPAGWLDDAVADAAVPPTGPLTSGGDPV